MEDNNPYSIFQLEYGISKIEQGTLEWYELGLTLFNLIEQELGKTI